MNVETLRGLSRAESPDQLLELAQAGGVELSGERAEELFAKYHPPLGELTDRELEDISGGGCGQSRPEPKFKVGDHVKGTGYVACEGSPGFPCRATYIVVTGLWYRESYHDYYYEVSCPTCHSSRQVFEYELLPA